MEFRKGADMKGLLYPLGGTSIDFIFHKSQNMHHLEIDTEVMKKHFNALRERR